MSHRGNSFSFRMHNANICDYNGGDWVKMTHNRRTEAQQEHQRLKLFSESGCGGCAWASCSKDILDGPSWEWKLRSDACDGPFQVMNANSTEQFCSKLAGDVLIVGDSISHLMTLSLAAKLQGDFVKRDDGGPSIRDDLETFLICGGARELRFIRSDWLDIGVHFGEDPRDGHGPFCTTSQANARCRPWVTELANVGLLVLNSGAHYMATSDYIEHMCRAAGEGRAIGGAYCSNMTIPKSYSTYSKSLNRIISNSSAIRVYRNTVPGHANCESTRLSPPFENVEEAEHFVLDNAQYNWERFHVHNGISQGIFQEAGFHLLDAYASGILRRDRHIDCLHSCLPGPIDHWNDLLFNLLAGV
eukprot:CAMPEP_0168440630 /NCGR_PEP_ID=MMETSP0228-20121227/43072_1 /TAXON_ID=133427 /ORGANISM="Protoceratium reticulatum, Strain CCCM 535 (=CCMP 1889)" /LENGTH=358 /DNA_ID=CAMNT_0008454927 /DNA_START=114 /DNA_END=1190 /DNA_ORIENTATION=+